MLLVLTSAVVAGTEFKSATDTAYLSVVEDDFNAIESGVYDPFAVSVSDSADVAVSVARGDTTSLRLTEVAVVAASGGVAAAGTDTASLTLTEVVLAGVAVDVTDTTSLTLTDGGAVDVYDNLISATDTTSLTLSDLGSVDRRNFGVIDFEDDDIAALRLEDVGTVARHFPVAGCRITIDPWSIKVTIR